jgi:hypothetical protein
MSLDNLEIHICSCARHEHMLLNLINSIKEFDFLAYKPIIIFEDEKDPISFGYRNKLEKLGAYIFSHKISNALKYLDKRYEYFFKYLISDDFQWTPGPTILSKFLYPINQNKSILSMDSDIVFLNYPNQIKSFILENKPFFISDIQDAYSEISQDPHDPFKPLDLLDTRINIGLFFIENFNLNSFLETMDYTAKYILAADLKNKSLVDDLPHPWYSSQTMMAFYLRKMNSISLDLDKYYLQGDHTKLREKVEKELNKKISNLEFLFKYIPPINFKTVEALHLTTPARKYLEDIIFLNIFYKNNENLPLELFKKKHFNVRFRELIKLINTREVNKIDYGQKH